MNLEKHWQTIMMKDGRPIGTVKQYYNRVKKLEPRTLSNIIRDCQDAIAANPGNQNIDYYRWEARICRSILVELAYGK